LLQEIPGEDGLVPWYDGPSRRLLLVQGVAFALAVQERVRRLPGVLPVRCVVGADLTGAVFRCHQCRPGESWLAGDLDGYEEPVVVVDEADG
jgi:hypothetical protein